ncbi:MAG: Hsp33 family molecular chaperone HslO [Hyphomonas sp.]|uniref:Hsp33 family molecular chaperone HslO n=1 Tax=Hyphomonas sp. TaxID=87 RepID=UPI0035295824
MPRAPLTASDFVANFQIDQRPVRGRAVRMGPQSVSPILHRHDYPINLARILGEAVTLAALVGSSLKFDGRLLVQAEGDGPVKMLVGEYRSDGGVRGYARFDAEAWEHLDKVNRGAVPHMPQLFGPAGRLALIIIQDNPAIQPYQGIVPLMKGTLAECAEDYFAQSEQVPTRIALSVAEFETPGDPTLWVSGGMMIQRIAADDFRGDTEEAWNEAQALFATVSDGELADPELPMEQLLYRLFHEQGVRLEPPVELDDRCTCNEDRLIATLSQMPDESLREMTEPDGTLSVDCQFCARHYSIPIEAVTGSTH